jgi:hypothetical protein
MRMFRIFLCVVLMLVPIASVAQSKTIVTASGLSDAAGNVLVSARLCFAPVDASGKALGFRAAAMQVLARPTCPLVSNGVLQAGFAVFDSSATVPTNVRYHIYATDVKNTGSVIRDFGITTISGTIWSLDAFDGDAEPLSPMYENSQTAGDLDVNGHLEVSGGMNVGTIDAGTMAASITALRSVTPTSPVRAFIADYGYGKGGGGIFQYSSSTITPDGCVNFAAAGGGTWVRQLQGNILWAEDCGAKSDDSTFDNEAAFEQGMLFAASNQLSFGLRGYVYYAKAVKATPLGTSKEQHTAPKRIFGLGQAATIIRANSAASGTFFNLTNATYTVLENLTIDGNNNSAITTVLDASINFQSAPSAQNTFRGITVTGNTTSGILFNGDNQNDSHFVDFDLIGTSTDGTNVGAGDIGHIVGAGGDLQFDGIWTNGGYLQVGAESLTIKGASFLHGIHVASNGLNSITMLGGQALPPVSSKGYPFLKVDSGYVVYSLSALGVYVMGGDGDSFVGGSGQLVGTPTLIGNHFVYTGTASITPYVFASTISAASGQGLYPQIQGGWMSSVWGLSASSTITACAINVMQGSGYYKTPTCIYLSSSANHLKLLPGGIDYGSNGFSLAQSGTQAALLDGTGRLCIGVTGASCPTYVSAYGFHTVGTAVINYGSYSSTGPQLGVGDMGYGLSAAGGNLHAWANPSGTIYAHARSFLYQHGIQSAINDRAGTCVMSSSTTCTWTLNAAYVSAPIGPAFPTNGSYTGGTAYCSAPAGGTTVTITAPTANSLTWGCLLTGNPN